jgi:hypothetical protein
MNTSTPFTPYSQRTDLRFTCSSDMTPHKPQIPFSHYKKGESTIIAINRIGQHFHPDPYNSSPPEASSKKYLKSFQHVSKGRYWTLYAASKRIHHTDKHGNVRGFRNEQDQRGHIRLLLWFEDSFKGLLATQTFLKHPTEAQMKRLRTPLLSSELVIEVKYKY